MSEKTEQVITAINPEASAKYLVAFLGADEGISATAQPVKGDLPGTWIVLTSTINLTIRPPHE